MVRKNLGKSTCKGPKVGHKPAVEEYKETLVAGAEEVKGRAVR